MTSNNKIYYVKNKFDVENSVKFTNSLLKTTEIIITTSAEIGNISGIILYFDGPRDIILIRCKENNNDNINYKSHDILPLYNFLANCLCNNFYTQDYIINISKKLIFRLFNSHIQFSKEQKTIFIQMILLLTK